MRAKFPMGFDKTKALNAAEKFLSQGKIPSAVQEYRKIVERDAADFTALNTLGDLYVRTKRADEAMDCFLRVAEHYREQGFALKAIAMYKKVARLDPQSPGVAQHLARLYEQQGLYVEARAQYSLVAEEAARAGRPVESLEALRRMADLDPANVDIRARLAEGYTREGMAREAADAYSEAGELLLSAGKSKEALDAYHHAHKLAPTSHSVLHGIVSASFAAGVAADAARILEQSIAGAPDDLELRAMLARAYVEAEDAAAAERATEALVAAEHTNYPLWFDVARLYLKQSKVDDGVRVLARAIEPALTGKQERAVLELLNDALALDARQLEALRLVLRIHTWHRDDEAARLTLERLADAARAHGETEEERRALEHLVRIVPFDQSYHERLSRLDAGPAATPALADRIGDSTQGFAHAEYDPPPDAQNLTSDAQQSVPPSADDAYAFAPAEHSASGPAARDATPFEAATSFEAAAFESFAEVQEPSAFEFVPARGVEAAHVASNGGERAVNEQASGESAASERAIARFDPSSSFADLNEGSEREGAAQAHAGFGLAIERNGFDETPARDAFSNAPGDPFASQPASAGEATPGEDERVRSLLRQELESVDFYLEQGYADIARDTLDMLERQYGARAETQARRARLGATAEGAAHAGAELHAVDERGESFVDLSAAEYSPEERAARAGEEFRIDEAALFVAAEETPNGAHAAPQHLDAKQTGAQQFVAPQIVPAEIVAEEAAPRSRHRPTRAADPHLASIFGEFLDDESEEPAPSNDSDYETHYNLGVAYKEMCLWDEAVEQFQKAFDLVGASDVEHRRIDCCNLLAHCLAQKGMPRAAVIWLKRALALPSLNEDEEQALRYDLAAAYEQAGDIDRAIDTFSEVYAVDVSYRGVAERLRELQSAKVVNR